MKVVGTFKRDNGVMIYGLEPLHNGVGFRGVHTFLPQRVVEGYRITDDVIGKEMEVYYNDKGYIATVQIHETLKK